MGYTVDEKLFFLSLSIYYVNIVVSEHQKLSRILTSEEKLEISGKERSLSLNESYRAQKSSFLCACGE